MLTAEDRAAARCVSQQRPLTQARLADVCAGASSPGGKSRCLCVPGATIVGSKGCPERRPGAGSGTFPRTIMLCQSLQ